MSIPLRGIIEGDTCRVGDRVTVSRTPILTTGCRELLAQGVDPALEIYRNAVRVSPVVRSLEGGVSR